MSAYCVVISCSSPCTFDDVAGLFLSQPITTLEIAPITEESLYLYVHISLVIELASKWSCLGYKLVRINCASKENLIGIKFRAGLSARFQFPHPKLLQFWLS